LIVLTIPNLGSMSDT